MPIRKRGKKYEVRVTKARLVPSLSRARLCEKHYQSALTQADHDFDAGSAPCIIIREGIEQYLHDCIAGLGRAPCNEKTAGLIRRRLLMFDAVFHSRPLDAISQKEVEDWMRRYQARPRRGTSVAGDTINKYAEILKSFARWAQVNGLAPQRLPLLLARRLRSHGKAAGKNWKPPQVMDIDSLLEIIDAIKAIRVDIGLFFQGMLYFNLRPSEVADLKRVDVRLPRAGASGSLDCRRLKTHHERTLPIETEDFGHIWARECLALSGKSCRKTDGAALAPLVICLSGRCRVNPGGWTTGNLDKAVARVCRRLDISIRPYLIRHSIISWLDDQPDVAQAAVTAHAGHTRATTTDIYRHRKAKDALPAYKAINKKLLRRMRETG